MDERFLDWAEQQAAAERADAITACQRATHGVGQDECDGCGELIPPDRRQAAPFATRCLSCQAAIELQRRAYRSPFCSLK